VADLTELDPRNLSVVDCTATSEGGALRGADPATFATLVKRTSAEQLTALDASPLRDRVLEIIFALMGEAFRGDRLSASRTSLVRWEITGARRSTFETELSRAGCTVANQGTRALPGEGTEREPRATLTLSFPEFLKLTSGNANADDDVHDPQAQARRRRRFRCGAEQPFRHPPILISRS
jgi:hypothetical protein